MTRMHNPEIPRHVVQQAREEGSAVRKAMCHGKDPLTFEQAKAITRRPSRRDRKELPYHCPVCRQWHIGRPMKKHEKRKGADHDEQG